MGAQCRRSHPLLTSLAYINAFGAEQVNLHFDSSAVCKHYSNTWLFIQTLTHGFESYEAREKFDKTNTRSIFHLSGYAYWHKYGSKIN